ncbi:E protein [Mikumi yellow baboon virus 1]|uniref:E protein n=1 Tax=Mikumi yellow baboon virus 1 TaxID=1546177 RepID=A0A089H3C5_9NIDO|nr:E protein [Mikumi yellow baboon virus 1]AIP91224.1 E protein [Mikumi yellow baboon virus 1]
MGSYASIFYHALQTAIHELIVSAVDLIIYFVLILLTLLVGKGIGLVLRSLFSCAAMVKPGKYDLPTRVSTNKARIL